MTTVTAAVECNICHWQGREFVSDSWHPHTVCPNCGSQVRHRLLMAALTHLEKVSAAKLVRGKRVLHFAPERVLAAIFRTEAGQYRTADLMREDLDLKLDITQMPSLAEGCFDLVVACDVLEHVEDDVRAMSEIYRILSPGGWAILTVPQKDNLAETFEDPTVVTPAERERVFGQQDHLRIYGDNFPALLSSARFEVTVVSEADFSGELVTRHVLFPPVISSRPLATNHRKVFFARKP